MLKATAGGGGRGIRMVASAADLEDAYERTSDEAQRAFGNGVVFLERLVTGARHVEVQLIADGHGTAWALGVRDCSIQRRNQKVIEESASPVLAAEQVAELKASAERLALAVGYVGAGTVEFLYDPGERLVRVPGGQHPPAGRAPDHRGDHRRRPGEGADPRRGRRPARPTCTPRSRSESGHAVEARLNAEDPDRDFAPAPGRIARLDLPAGPGIRVDTGVGEGDTIPPDFDSMIAKIIAFGRNRDEALARLRRAMRETTVVIEGGATNKSFVLDLLAQPEVVDGTGGWADTGWIDRRARRGPPGRPARTPGSRWSPPAIEAYADEVDREVARLLETAHGGRPQVQHRVGRPVEVKLRGTAYQVSTLNTGPSRYQVTIAVAGGTTHRRRRAGPDRRVPPSAHGRRPATPRGHGHPRPDQLVEVDGVTHRVTRDEGGVLRSPAPALVVATPAAVGDEVDAGAPVLVLESMKMETVLHAPFPARVKELLVITGSQVETGYAAGPARAGRRQDVAAEATSTEPPIELPQPPSGDRRPRSCPAPAAT